MIPLTFKHVLVSKFRQSRLMVSSWADKSSFAKFQLKMNLSFRYMAILIQ